MRHRVTVVLLALGIALLLWWQFGATPTSAPAASTTADLKRREMGNAGQTPAEPARPTGKIGAVLARDGAVNTAGANTTASNAARYLPVEQDKVRFMKRMRATAIRQANAIALAQLPTDIVQALAELRLADAQRLLEPLAATGHAAADRLLASMGHSHRRGQPCLPHTEFVAGRVAIQQMEIFDRHRRNALAVVPPAVAGILAESEPVFERTAVLSACAELTIDDEASWQRLLATAADDDENRLFLSRYKEELGFALPERAPDAEGNERPPYSRAIEAGIAGVLQMNWRMFNDRAEHNIRLVNAATAAEPYPKLFALAGNALFDHRNPVVTEHHGKRGLAYLASAAERGDRLGLERYGTELMRHADSMEQGYLLSLFARHLNAYGCYPADYLQEWERQYRYVEEYAQAMSPVTLESVQEKAAKYIKANAAQAYDHLHCRD
ncbi:MAG: hypothetical protein ACOY3E_14790 [Pseudomonadota bacterium]